MPASAIAASLALPSFVAPLSQTWGGTPAKPPWAASVAGTQRLLGDELSADSLLNNPGSCSPRFDSAEMLILHGRLISSCGFNGGRIKAFRYIFPTLLPRAE